MKRLIALGTFLSLATLLTIPAYGDGFFGAIYTSKNDGSTVNANLFAHKADVYLNGGPQNANSQGLPDGNYYFQVTNPSGSTLLSTDDAVCRQVTVSGGVISGVVVTGCEHAVGFLNPITHVLPVQLIPYADTDNNGNEYKVWLIRNTSDCVVSIAGAVINIANGNCTKTDNFKVLPDNPPPNQPPQSLVGGVKFYDAPSGLTAPNGVLDPGEAPLAGFTIHVIYTNGGVPTTSDIITDAGGNWSVTADQGTTLSACETNIPSDYTQTSPLNLATAGVFTANASKCWSGTVPTDAVVSGLNFGNVATISGNKYYDGNANGEPTGDATLNGFKVVACFDAGCSGVQVTYSTFTSGSGGYSFYLPSATSTYQVCEITPNSTTWLQTGPMLNAALFPANTGSGSASATGVKCWSGSGPTNGLFLTNVCFASTGGHTLGFWSNKNGQTLENDSDLAFLSTIFLRNAAGTVVTFPSGNAGKSALNSFLLGATATNMANMLYAQLAAMELNVRHSFLTGSTLIYAPGTNSANSAGFATIDAVMAEAIAILTSNGSILSGDLLRTRAEAVKNALDNANNNKNIVSSTPCTFTSPY